MKSLTLDIIFFKDCMFLKIITVLNLTLLLIGFSSCASFKESYRCGRTYTLQGEKYQRCAAKDNSDGLKMGLVKSGSTSWLVSPRYNSVLVVNDRYVYLKERSEEFYELYDAKKDKYINTDITVMQKPFEDVNYYHGWSKFFYGVHKDGTYSVMNVKTGLFQDKRLKDVDKPYVITGSGFGVTHNTMAEPFIVSPYGDSYMVRFNKSGKRFYQLYKTNGEPLDLPTIPAEKVVIRQFVNPKNTKNHFIIPFEILDAERNLVWPIIFNDSGILVDRRKDKRIVGAIDSSYEIWKDYKRASGRLVKIPIFSDLNILFNDGSITIAKSIHRGGSNVVTLFNQALKEKPLFREYINVIGKDVTLSGVPYDRSYSIFKNQDGKYVYGVSPDRVATGTNAVSFQTKEEALGAVLYRTDNIHQISKSTSSKYRTEQYKKYAKQKEALAEQKRINDERQRKAWADYYKKKAAIDARNAAEKAERNAGWNALGKQILQEGDRASKRADCVRKRAESKQAAADGKQGWYLSGGCN